MSTKVFDAREVGCTIGGLVVDDFVEFKHKNDLEVSHIGNIKEMSGYNIKPPKPSWSVVVKETSKTLAEIAAMRDESKIVEVVYTSPTRTVTCLACIIGTIDYGTGGSEAGNVTVNGLALKINEETENSSQEEA